MMTIRGNKNYTFVHLVYSLGAAKKNEKEMWNKKHGIYKNLSHCF